MIYYSNRCILEILLNESHLHNLDNDRNRNLIVSHELIMRWNVTIPKKIQCTRAETGRWSRSL